MEEKRIEVYSVKDDIATCNACLIGNYESSLWKGRKKTDKLYEVRINGLCVRLCKSCLLELVSKATGFLSGEEVPR